MLRALQKVERCQLILPVAFKSELEYFEAITYAEAMMEMTLDTILDCGAFLSRDKKRQTFEH